MKTTAFKLSYKALLAERIILTLLPSQGMIAAHNEKGELPSPKELAIYACDVAEQIYEQLSEREWFVTLDEPRSPD